MIIAFSGSRRLAPNIDQLQMGLSAIAGSFKEKPNSFIPIVGDCPTGTDAMITAKWEPIVEVFKADWDSFGSRAGPIRNGKMIDDSHALVAFPCPRSKGTWDAIRKAAKKGIPVVIIPLGVE